MITFESRSILIIKKYNYKTSQPSSLIKLYCPSSSRVNCWKQGPTRNGTIVLRVSSHHDVTVLSPVSTPRVLHNPVISIISSSVAHNQHTVVYFVAVVTTFFVFKHAPCKDGSFITLQDGSKTLFYLQFGTCYLFLIFSRLLLYK